MSDTIESLRAEVARLREGQNRSDQLARDTIKIAASNKARALEAEAQRDALRAVVQTVEWCCGESDAPTCPICGAHDYDDHKTKCALRAALEQSNG